MSLAEFTVIGILLSSLLPGLAIFLLPEGRGRLRRQLNLLGAVTKVLLVALMLWSAYHGARYEVSYVLLPGVELLLRVDPLGLLFVSLSAVLWLLATIYAVGYMEGEAHLNRFFGFFSLCVSATVGIALAGNLLTLFLFYEMLTLSTYPLVIHHGGRQDVRAGRSYLVYTLSGSTAILGGLVWLWSLAGPLDFRNVEGALSSLAAGHETSLRLIFLLLVGGFGVKAALFPLHAWLPRAMVAPTPVSALLHAVAVVKAGAFGIIRVVYDVYGGGLAHQLGVTSVLAAVAAFTILYGSIQALRQHEIKPMLAYSTISQLSYIVLGTALAGPLATTGGLVHLVHQGLMKVTLFFCAGCLSRTLGIHALSELAGTGRRMPLTMAAFTLAGLGMMAAPPLVGFISKWYLALGGVSHGDDWVLWLLLLSSLLNAGYFLPPIYRAWFVRPSQAWPRERAATGGEADPRLVWPTVITALLSLLFGLFAGAWFSPLHWVRFIVLQEFAP